MILAIVGLIGFVGEGYSQDFGSLGLFGSASTNVIIDGVKCGLGIVRQEYVLSDTTAVNPSKYGFNNNDYFGRGYDLGVVVDGKLITRSSILKPWVGDANYSEYANDNSVRVELSKRYVRAIDSDSFEKLDSDMVISNSSDSLAVVANDLEGFTSDITTGKKENGWVVVVSGEVAQIDTLTNFKVEAYNTTLEVNDDQPAEVKKISLSKEFIGGLYVVPTYEKIGVIELKVVGMLSVVNDKWYVLPVKSILERTPITLTAITSDEPEEESVEVAIQEIEEIEEEEVSSKKSKKNKRK